ncbi:MAG: twin-arginine translocase TatA/TatE family subunit [Bacteroidia bacterium]
MALGPWQIILILFVIILLFGAKRIPELAKGIGKGIREFKDASKEEEKKKEETKD